MLYILHNAPVWISTHIFQKIHRLFRELLWKKQYARIKLETLQRDKDSGGLAIHNAWLYFIAPQWQHFTAWGQKEGWVLMGDYSLNGLAGLRYAVCWRWAKCRVMDGILQV